MPSPPPWIIETLGRELIAAAKRHGLPGRLRIVHRGMHYFIIAIVHAKDTVSARSAPSTPHQIVT